MPGEKRFGTSMFGFKKSDVNAYIEKILREFEDKLNEKDDEISALKSQLRDLRTKYEELSMRADQIKDDRSKIADVLIQAKENAELILENAKLQAIDERKKLEDMVEREKEKLVDIKAELKTLKSEVVNTLKKYEGQLSEMIEVEAEE